LEVPARNQGPEFGGDTEGAGYPVGGSWKVEVERISKYADRKTPTSFIVFGGNPVPGDFFYLERRHPGSAFP
jgi:hypothetical protein